MTKRLSHDLSAEVPDNQANRWLSGVAERLNSVVKAAGGPSAISRKSGVPLNTLNAYLRGATGMKLPALFALAQACGVSLDYLATGQTGIGDNHPSPEVIGPPPELRLFRDADIARLGAALHEAFALIRERRADPDWEDIARIVALLYDNQEIIRSGGVP